jgi:hypothetical protein
MGGGCSPLPTSHMTGGMPHEKEGVGVRVSSLEKGGTLLHLRTYTHAPFRPCQGCFQMLQRRGGMFSPTTLFVTVGRIFECWEGEAVLSSCSAFAPLSGRFSDSQGGGERLASASPPPAPPFCPFQKDFHTVIRQHCHFVYSTVYFSNRQTTLLPPPTRQYFQGILYES